MRWRSTSIDGRWPKTPPTYVVERAIDLAAVGEPWAAWPLRQAFAAMDPAAATRCSNVPSSIAKDRAEVLHAPGGRRRRGVRRARTLARESTTCRAMPATLSLARLR
jgi:hypothetical protein